MSFLFRYSSTPYYTYDGLNRLASATETYDGVTKWKQVFTYDRWGNRSWGAGTTANVQGPPVNYILANNHIDAFGYDQVGNLIATPWATYGYDAENRLTSVNNGLATYVYDGEGRRVKKTIVDAVTTVTRMVYNHLGQLIAEYDRGGALETEYVYRGSEVIATVYPTLGAWYATTDHLGSPRVWTDSTGAVVAGGRHDYLPFGEELLAGPPSNLRPTGLNYPAQAQADGQRIQFTHKERDGETNLDYFGARHYANTLGRFMSVDPGKPNLENPQKWNGYQYTLNNPLRYVDPNGEAELSAYLKQAANFIDQAAFTISKPALKIMVGILNDDPLSIVSGQAEIAASALVGVGIGKGLEAVAARVGPQIAQTVGRLASEEAGALYLGRGGHEALLNLSRQQLEKRFTVFGEEQIKKVVQGAVPDLVGIAKSKEFAVVEEVTTGLKSLTHLRAQLEGGREFLLSKDFTGRIRYIVRTTNKHLVKEIEEEAKKSNFWKQVKVIFETKK